MNEHAQRRSTFWAQLEGALDFWADPETRGGQPYSDAELAAFVRAMHAALSDPAATLDPAEYNDDPS